MSVSVAFSRDQGQTFDSAFTLGLTAASEQMVATGYPYTAGRYPRFEVTTTDRSVRLYRFWIASRVGGR